MSLLHIGLHLLLMLLAIMVYTTKGQNSQKNFEFYKNLISKEQKNAYSYRNPTKNNQFWKGDSNTSNKTGMDVF